MNLRAIRWLLARMRLSLHAPESFLINIRYKINFRGVLQKKNTITHTHRLLDHHPTARNPTPSSTHIILLAPSLLAQNFPPLHRPLTDDRCPNPSFSSAGNGLTPSPEQSALGLAPSTDAAAESRSFLSESSPSSSCLTALEHLAPPAWDSTLTLDSTTVIFFPRT